LSEAENIGALKRLHWRCRRGTRELDALLGGWLDEYGARADAQTLAAFDALLDEPDPQIWDWLMGHERTPRTDWQEIVDAIRARNRI
jgi:antitoxin CptB